jgi:CubicO group peptidase (beta-lactamase class C family)
MKYKTAIVCLILSVSQAVLSFTWPEQTPEEAGLNSAHIDATLNRISTGQYGAIRSLLIIKDGHLVTESYFASAGEKNPVYSVTKSIGSTLLGIAKYQGAEINFVQPFLDYLPQYNNINNQAQVRQITLQDLLTQRHGYDWDEWSTPFTSPANPVYQMMGTNDWYRTAANWTILYQPNQKFAYSSGHSSLMSPILQNRTGRDVDEFLNNELFSPLDITDYQWNVFNPRSPGQGITQFPGGLEPLGFGLWLKPIDMAKIGELYRLKGMWQGDRLLSEEWIEQTVMKYSDHNTDPEIFNDASGYGLQWWITQLTDTNNRSVDMYYASGFARQYIFVIPEYDAVIVSTATDYNNDGPGIGTLMSEHLLLAFEDQEPKHPLTSDLNGSWFDPENSGQGFNIEILNNNTDFLGYWYTYEPSGGQQRWFVLRGNIEDDTANFTIMGTQGGEFLMPTPPNLVEWGTGSFKANNCATARVTFDSTLEMTSGEIELSRITAGPGACLPSKTAKQLGPYLY